jgi:hypothetical protein
MAGPEIRTVREQLAWSYANLARAHAALAAGRTRYAQIDHIIRSRLFKGLCSGAMSIGSIVDDERLSKLAQPACAYCGASAPLVLDHLIPRATGGFDAAVNLVAACRACNSSKGACDLVSWTIRNGRFPPILVLRRYLKVCALHCEHVQTLDLDLGDPALVDLPMPIDKLPCHLPPLVQLRLHAGGSN